MEHFLFFAYYKDAFIQWLAELAMSSNWKAGNQSINKIYFS